MCGGHVEYLSVMQFKLCTERPTIVCYLKLSRCAEIFAGADVNLSDFLGKTPLYICVNNSIVHTAECKMAVQKLIHAGAIVDKYVNQSRCFLIARLKFNQL